MNSPVLLLQSVARPHSVREWRLRGFDYLIDVAVDIAGVLVGALVLWLLIRLIAQRIERWGDDGRPDLHSAREQRTKTAAKLFRSVGRAVLVVVTMLLVLGQLGFNIGPFLASAGVVGSPSRSARRVSSATSSPASFSSWSTSSRSAMSCASAHSREPSRTSPCVSSTCATRRVPCTSSPTGRSRR
jgi:hypothetical protein